MQNDGGRTTLSGQRFPSGIADPFSAILRPFLWARRREEIAVSTISEDVSDAGFKVAIYVGFPEAQHKPTELRQGFIYILVALDVAGEFFQYACLDAICSPGLSSCPRACQKSPSTKMAILRRVKAMSGVPGSARQFFR